tara:strand:- start:5884 stop:6321 length:438 start_codon:yes stop_codon:yes gene_type:complete
MIKEFKIKSNYIIEGSNVEVAWRTKDALFIKFHAGSWLKGWFNNSDKALFYVDRNIKEISLYAFGWKGIEKKVIPIKINKYKFQSSSNGKIKHFEFSPVKNKISPNTKFKPNTMDFQINIDHIKLKKQEITLIDTTNTLKLNNHE